MTEIVGILGISGVGKSTLISHYINNQPEWKHLQAGNLIRSELENIEHDKLRLEGNDAILKNQYLMVDAFWKEVESNKLTKVIFDGHSVIDTGTELLPIPYDIISALKLSKLLFMKVDSRTIFFRRANDKSRDRPQISEETIQKHQDAALKQTKEYSDQLNIPLLVIENPQMGDLDKYI